MTKLLDTLSVLTKEPVLLFTVVARDLPGGKRILTINMRAQHITFNKAIKTVEIFKDVLIVTFRLFV